MDTSLLQTGRDQLANLITLSRCLFGGVVFWMLAANHSAAAAVFFMLGALTDGVDGRVARSLNQVSPLGGLLDAVADRVLLTCAAAGLLVAGRMRDEAVAMTLLLVAIELVFGMLFTRKTGRFYLLGTHRDSMRLLACAAYVAAFWFIAGLPGVAAMFCVLLAVSVFAIADCTRWLLDSSPACAMPLPNSRLKTAELRGNSL